ncbi:hypothetical protein [Streptomyces sp. NPDC059802]|uniref:hypothetical protein n=1 Tax=Streptomyces sp. NPDC059802 TaxID=3346952 RepID=UPI00364F4151
MATARAPTVAGATTRAPTAAGAVTRAAAGATAATRAATAATRVAAGVTAVTRAAARGGPGAAPGAPAGGGGGARGSGGGGGGGRDRGHDRKREERIYFNEREYGAYPGGCVPAASGLGSSSFSIYNDSRYAVEVFRGFACDGGSPVATVGPYGSTYGVVTPNVRGGGFIDNGVAGSFRVIGHYEEW